MDALMPTLKRVAAALEHERVPYLLGGSIACWARGGPPLAKDLDFMVKPSDADRALAALVAAGMGGERPPEQWLYKAWDDGVLIDLIFGPSGLEMSDEVFARGDRFGVGGMQVDVMALEDLLTTMLFALDEHTLDYEHLLQISRSLREQIDWAELRARTGDSPYARAFMTLVEELGVAPRVEEPEAGRPRIRVA